MARQLSLTLKAKSGTINRFYAFVEGKRVIAEDGTKEGSWKGEVSENDAPIKVRVWGIASADFTLKIDLPGTANDQELTFSLRGGYFECELSI